MARRLHRILRALVWLCGGLVLALALPFLLLLHPATRSFAVDRALAIANDHMDYKVEITEVSRLDPWGLEVHGLAVFDPKGRELARAREVSARLVPRALLQRTLRVSRLEVQGVRARLPEQEEEQRAAEPEESQGAEDESSAFSVRVDDCVVSDVKGSMRSSGRTYGAVIDTLSGSGTWGEQPSLAIARADLTISEGGETLLALESERGAWDGRLGGEVRIVGSLAGAPLELTVKAAPMNQKLPWPRGELRARISGLGRRSLRELGVENGADLHVPVSLIFRVSSTGARADLNALVRAGRARLTLMGVATRTEASLSAQLAETDLTELSGQLPARKLEGTLHTRYVYASAPQAVELRWTGIRIDEEKLPNGQLSARLALPVINLESLRFEEHPQALSARGRWNIDTSSGWARLTTNELALASLAGLSGAGVDGVLDSDLSVRIVGERLSGSGSARVRALHIASIQVSRGQLDFEVSGTTEAPEGWIELGADDLRNPTANFDRIELTAQGDAQGLEASLRARGPDTSFRARLLGKRLPKESFELSGDGLGEVLNYPLFVAFSGVRSGERKLSRAELSAHSGSSLLRVQGELRDSGVLRGELRASSLDLRALTRLLGVEGVTGTLEASASVDGTSERPHVEAEVLAVDVAHQDQTPIDGRLLASAELATGHVDGQLVLSSERDLLNTSANLEMDIPRASNGELSFADARYRARLRARVPVARVARYGGPKWDALRGSFEASLNAEGTIEEPLAHGEVSARLTTMMQQDEPDETFHLAFDVRPDKGQVRVRASDLSGELLSLDALAQWPGGSLRAALTEEVPRTLPPFSVRARLSPRRLDAMQGVYAYLTNVYDIDRPMRAGLTIDLRGDGTNVDGEARARLVLLGDLLDPRCELGTRSNVDIDVDIARNDLAVELRARTDQGGVIDVTADTRLSLKLAAGESPFGPIRLRARGTNLEMDRLPGMCDLVKGRGAFSLDLANLGSGPARGALEIGLEDLESRGGGPVSARAFAGLSAQAVEISGELRAAMRPAGTFTAHLPLAYAGGSMVPEVPAHKPVHAHFRARDLPLAPFLSLGEQLGRPQGYASIDLSVAGSISAPKPSGFIELRDVSFSVASLAQPLRDIDGRLRLSERSLTIESLSARDRDGKLELAGEASLGKQGGGRARLELHAKRFPLRKQGLVVGELSTNATITAKLNRELRAHVDVDVKDGRVWITGVTGKTVQSLDAHPDIHIVDAPEDEDTAQDEGDGGPSLAVLKLDTSKNIWLMHRDFSVELGVHIELRDEATQTLEGVAEIRRGELQILGKSFRIEKGAVRFTGDFPPDPELELHATYEPPVGEKLIVDVSGRASQPTIGFSGAADTAGEAVAVLSGVGRAGAENQAQTDVENFAASLTAGLLSVTARRKFGDWVPVISYEKGAGGDPGRARAGFDATKIIPPFLRGVARGAYVEGIVGSTQETPGGSGGVGLGVRLEVALPRDFVTSMGYGPGPTWSTDVAWSP